MVLVFVRLTCFSQHNIYPFCCKWEHFYGCVIFPCACACVYIHHSFLDLQDPFSGGITHLTVTGDLIVPDSWQKASVSHFLAFSLGCLSLWHGTDSWSKGSGVRQKLRCLCDLDSVVLCHHLCCILIHRPDLMNSKKRLCNSENVRTQGSFGLILETGYDTIQNTFVSFSCDIVYWTKLSIKISLKTAQDIKIIFVAGRRQTRKSEFERPGYLRECKFFH